MSSAYIGFLAAIAVRTLCIAMALTIGLRLLGRKQAGQMNMYDLVMIMCIANAVQNAITNGKGELGVGVVASITLLLTSLLAGKLFTRLPGAERRLMGEPILLIHDGMLQGDVLRREGISHRQLQAELRQHGLIKTSQVQMAVLEADGSLSIIPKDSPAEHARRYRHTGARKSAD